MNEKEIIIGTINLDDEFMFEGTFSDVMKLKKRGNCDISIYTNEGANIPHFHIKPDIGPDICIEIFYPRLFKHGDHIGTINSKEARKLNEIIDDKNTGIWKRIRDEWINAFPGIRKQCSDIKQPNYATIVEDKPDKSGFNMYKIKYEPRKDVYTINGESFIVSKLGNVSCTASADPENQIIIISGFTKEPIAKIDKAKITEFFYVKTRNNECKEIWLSNLNKDPSNYDNLRKLLNEIGLEKINFTK